MNAHRTKLHIMLDAILAIRRAARTIDDIVDEACNTLSITGVQYNILRVLSRAPSEGLSRTAIVDSLIEHHADVTRSIDGLVMAGYVEREHSTHDRRVVLHRLTLRGQQALDQIDPYLTVVLEKMAKSFTNDELRYLVELCRRLFT